MGNKYLKIDNIETVIQIEGICPYCKEYVTIEEIDYNEDSWDCECPECEKEFIIDVNKFFKIKKK